MSLSFLAIERYLAAQKHDELGALEDLLVGENLQAVLEIGTYRGGTLWMWCRLAGPEAIVVSVDLPGGRYGGGYDEEWRRRLERMAGTRQSLHLLQADSHLPSTREAVVSALDGRELDLLFIDGDHTYEGVRADFDDYSPLVGVGGLIALHDIAEHDPEKECHVDRLWDELCTHAEYEVVGEYVHGDPSWGGIGVLRKVTTKELMQ